MVGKIFGTPIVIIQNHENGDQKRRHKKKRINKKWLKRYGVYRNQRLEKGQVLMINGTFYMSRATLEKLKMSLTFEP